MCVIMLVDEGCPRPTEEMIKKAWDTNDDGGGIAWREKNKRTGEVEVVWKKGLDYTQLKKLIETVPLPFVAHFRIQTHGGVRDSLTHPYPCDVKASLALSGRTKGYVLFHNGTWGPWDIKALEGAAVWKQKIPTGVWSDTRAMAYLCSPEMYGHGYMSLLDQKGIVFGPEDMQIYMGRGTWEEINGVWCSNDIFWKKQTHQHTTSYGPMCKYGQCTRRDNLDRDQRCPAHPLATQGAPASISTSVNGSGGSQGASSTPFHQSAGINPLPRVSLEVAEKLRREHKISQNLIKDIRKVFSKIGMGKVLKEKDLKKLARVQQAIAV